MKWITLITVLLPLIKELVSVGQECDDCTDEQAKELADASSEIHELQSELASFDGTPTAGVLDFIKCVDLNRLIEWVKEGIAIFKEASDCEPLTGGEPDGKCDPDEPNDPDC